MTGGPIDSKHAMSVLVGILDMETLKHTGSYQSVDKDVSELKRKVLEFVNMMAGSNGKGDAMDLDRVQEAEEEEEGEQDSWFQGEAETLNGLGEKCFNCNGFGHYARECPHPSKGKGKGKGYPAKGGGKGGGYGYGSSKGAGGQFPKGKGKAGGKGGGKAKGKGKSGGYGPRFGGCYICGEAHYARDCPQKRAMGLWESPSWQEEQSHGGIRCLSCVRKTDEKEHDKTVQVEGERMKVEQLLHRHKEVALSDKETDDLEGWQVKVRKVRKALKHVQSLSPLITVMPEGFNTVGVGEGEWEAIEIAVDSGATETVVGEDMLTGVRTEIGDACRRGVQYEVASGTLIPNLGEKRFVAVGEGGEIRKMIAQVCEVNKPLLSVKRMTQAGNRVVFDSEGSYVEDKQTGEVMWLREEGGMYMLKLWVKGPGPF